ncbi:hypothetical protein N657DRAFT_650129 [Parathielavia appendiculata]|uniref:Uncharacterized protein n=1 Tax=Parathielavia appendiculata TaxID=2587402 RepID=A0AAN6TRV4_9PEZI|nr:hypothetical protein N657DRAFT_650129 [Parathielavia appendiculata]
MVTKLYLIALLKCISVGICNFNLTSVFNGLAPSATRRNSRSPDSVSTQQAALGPLAAGRPAQKIEMRVLYCEGFPRCESSCQPSEHAESAPG